MGMKQDLAKIFVKYNKIVRAYCGGRKMSLIVKKCFMHCVKEKKLRFK